MPPTKQWALAHGLPVLQPEKVKQGRLKALIEPFAPDVLVVTAYGRILQPDVLAMAPLGAVNAHASILPKYRGAAPIQWAVARGETETGVTIMQMDEGLDTGPVYAERRVAILKEDDAGALSVKLAELAATVVREDLPRAVGGELRAVPQDGSMATFAPPLTREHGKIDWNMTSQHVVDRVRGLSPRPGAFTSRAGRTLKVLGASGGPVLDAGQASRPGTVIRADRGGLWVSASDRAVVVERAQLEGKKAMNGVDLVNGRAVQLGDVLGC